MPDSQFKWTAKTLGIVIVVAVIVSVATTFLQLWIWGKSNGAVSGGAATAVAVLYFMSRRKRLQDVPSSTPTQP